MFEEIKINEEILNNYFNDIYEYWYRVYNEDIWTNEKLRWLVIINKSEICLFTLFEKLKGLKNQIHVLELNKINLDNYNNFDIVIGIPPFISKKGKVKRLNITLIDKYIKECSFVSFLMSSHWFKDYYKLRKIIIDRTDVVYLKYFDNDVCYLLIDKNYNGLCSFNNNMIKLNKYNILIDYKYHNLVDKMITYKNITEIFIKHNYYGLKIDDPRFVNKKLENHVKCYISRNKGYKYIDEKYILVENNFYKVNLFRRTKNKDGFGKLKKISYPGEVYTNNYISFKVLDKNEAESLISYLNCKIPNLLLSLRKNNLKLSKNHFIWIPLPPLDRIWDDDKFNSFYHLE